MNKEVPQSSIQRILFFLFLLSSTVFSQWSKQSPIPTYLDLRGIAAPTTQKIFIATSDNSFDDGGALFESTDGGGTWIQRDIPISLSEPLNGLFFLDSQNGWTYGNDNYRTTDGGTNWIQMQFLGSTYFMEFYTPSFGSASGNFGTYISHDGGISWVPTPNGISSLRFKGLLVGLGVSDSGLYRTTDGGNTFSVVYTGSAKAAEFLSSNVAAAIVNDTYIRSTDGGVTWSIVTAVNNRNRLFRVSDNIILSWNELTTFPSVDGNISRSTDGGQTWTDLGNLIPNGILAFALSDPQTVAASDIKGNMFRSSDAGLTWVQTFTTPGPGPYYLSSAVPVFANSQTGYFGYGLGYLIKTTDGGASWFQISSGSGQSLNDIARFPNGNMIAVGDGGTLLTSNGTSPWVQKEIPTILDLLAVQVLSNTDAVVLDKTGKVYKTNDGAVTWTAAGASPQFLDAKDLHFNNLLDGWVTGMGFNESALFHTTNGGNSWIPVDSIWGSYTAVDFEGINGWALNVTGIYQRTTDNGLTWNLESLPGFPSQVSDIDFFNADTGYVVGSGGYALRSTDGGATWQVLPTPNNTDNFTGIYLISADELWISTNNDAAYYSANGGMNWAVLDISSDGFGYYNAITASADGDAWTVGYQGYIEHFTGPPPPPLNQPPTAAFDHLSHGLTVQFIDKSTDLDGTIVSWSWDFGDSTSSTERNPLHTFTTANTFIIRLTVTDNEGGTGNTLRIIAVQPGPGGTFGDFTEVTPLDSIFVTPENEDFWVITTAPADYDGDGDTDIAVLGYYVVYNQSVEDRLLLLRNDGPVDSTHWGFSYNNVPLGELTTGSSDIAWGDLDRDGDLDLVVGTDGATVIYRNDTGSLIMSDTQLPGYYEVNDQADFDLRSITLADYDNDGDLDILLPSVYEDSTFSFRTVLLRNDSLNGTGGWMFTEVNSGFAGTRHAQTSWADYDGDQDLDLLLVNIDPGMDEGFIRRYRNDGNGIFVGEDILGTLTVEHGEAQWGDYDNDGDLDILIAGNIKEVNGTYTDALRVYRNDSGNYLPVEVIDCIPCVGWVDISAATWADYDSDGDIDILLAGSYNSGSQIEGRAKIYINNNGVFTDSGNDLPAPLASGDRGGTFSWLDIDGEGDLDYFIAGQYFVPGGNGLVEAQMHVYRNDASGQNLAPTIPGGMNAAIQNDKSVLLSWTPSTDDHTPGIALTYDLEVFHNNVPVNIPKRLPEPGSISAATEWLLEGLKDGNYKWTLRAVDAAYIGSPAATGEFNIGLVGVNDPKDNLPTVYSIAESTNPFNPSTTIRYALPKEGLVTLKLYNALGEEQRVLVNEVKQAGNYQFTFDAGSLSSGVYFYRISSGSFTETKKMILLK